MSSSKILSRWGVIGVSGNDAVSFLHTQLSNDITTLDENTLRLAGLCSAKGRLFSTFFVFRKAEDVFLICRHALIPNLVKRLSMFVLRSKCKVMDLTSNYALEFVDEHPTDGPCMHVTWNTATQASLSLRVFNQHLCGLRMVERTPLLQTTESHTDEYSDDAFEEALIHLGIPHIAPNLLEQFIPQAINLDLIGGVSFSKGCYPGQEVVARSHYLGKIKRRTFKAKAKDASVLTAGADVWMADKDNEPVGLLVNTVQSTALVELPIDFAEAEGAVFVVKTEHASTVLEIELPPYDIHQKGNQFENVSTNTGLK